MLTWVSVQHAHTARTHTHARTCTHTHSMHTHTCTHTHAHTHTHFMLHCTIMWCIVLFANFQWMRFFASSLLHGTSLLTCRPVHAASIHTVQYVIYLVYLSKVGRSIANIYVPLRSYIKAIDLPTVLYICTMYISTVSVEQTDLLPDNTSWKDHLAMFKFLWLCNHHTILPARIHASVHTTSGWAKRLLNQYS